METRRGFLKLLGSLMITSATDQIFGKEILSPTKSDFPFEYDILWRSYLPTLKLNEDEKLHFYRCSRKKLTVGYGCNIEDNPNLIKDIPILYKGRTLSPKEKDTFLACHKEKTKQELANYTITKTDAVAMAKKAAYSFIKELEGIFKDTKTDKNILFNLPIPMQILALDVLYNLGKTKFLKYKKMKAALIKKDYEAATKESVVFIGPNATNKKREKRKKRLFSITKILQENPSQSLKKIQEFVDKSYQTETPKLTRILIGSKERICENAIICGEFERLQKGLKIAKLQTTTTKKI